MADSGSTINDVKSYASNLAGEVMETFMTNFNIKSIKEVIGDVDIKASQLIKTFGQGREQIVAIKAAMADAVTSVVALGGSFGEIYEIQKGIAETLGRNLILNSDSYEKLYATTKVTGQGAKELTEGFKNVGYSVYQIGDQMTKVVDSARSIGVNAEKVSGEVVKNMSSMNMFNFQGGVEGLAKMAAQAVNLRVDMSNTLKIAEGLFSPEKAIDMAAAMQRLGVAQGDLLDPLRLMDLAQNDPAELQNQIVEMSKSFTRLNEEGQFEIAPGEKLRMKELAESMGMPISELQKMALGSAELERKMSKIQFPEFATKEQQELIANMAEMDSKTGEYKITMVDSKTGEKVDKNITELSIPDIEKLKEASAPKSMEDLAKQQLDTQTSMKASLLTLANRTGYALAGTKTVTQAEDAGREAYSKIPKIPGKSFSVEDLRENMGEGLDNFIKAIGDGKPIEALMGAATGTAKFLDTAFKESFENTKKVMDELAKSTNPVIQAFEKIGKSAVNAGLEHEKIKVNDFTIETHPEDKLVMFGGTNLDGNKNSGTPTQTDTKTTADINLNIKIDAPSNIDTAQLMLAFNDQSVRQQMIDAFQKGLSNSNGSGPLNPIESRKQMMNLGNMV
jgi:hypothetical protein